MNSKNKTTERFFRTTFKLEVRDKTTDYYKKKWPKIKRNEFIEKNCK